jgi:hypothetical protein
MNKNLLENPARWEELWLPIRGYSNYEVSSQGRVRNLKTSRIMKQA